MLLRLATVIILNFTMQVKTVHHPLLSNLKVNTLDRLHIRHVVTLCYRASPCFTPYFVPKKVCMTQKGINKK
jgi:hypothetical protein